jgi:flagellar protein FlgJ
MLMSGISRIGSTNNITRDSASAGLEAQQKAADKAADRGESARPRDARLDAAAKMYEKEFLREMVKAMRGTISYGAMKPGMAENIYRGELDSHYVDTWGENGGVGLADLIYNQIMERYFSTTAGKSIKQQGSIALTDRDVSRVARMKSDIPGQVGLKVDVNRASGEASSPVHLNAPWASEVLSNVRVEGGKTALTLGHGPGLRSTLIFDGVAAAGLERGAKIEKGRTVGILGPDVDSFFWNLQNASHLDAGRGQKSAGQSSGVAQE